jgi:hypothetical protein
MKYRIIEHEYLYGVKEFIAKKSVDGKIWIPLFDGEFSIENDNTFGSLDEALNVIKEYAARLQVLPEETIHEVTKDFTIKKV